MNSEKVFFAFFILLALSLNFSFYAGDIDNPNHHHSFELFSALIVSLICTIMKFGDRSHFGATVLASSLVADLHLVAAVILWTSITHIEKAAISADSMANIVSLSGGALIANLVSVILLIIETYQTHR